VSDKHECTNCKCGQPSDGKDKPDGQGGSGQDKKPPKSNDQQMAAAYDKLKAAEQAERAAKKKYDDSGGGNSDDYNDAVKDKSDASKEMEKLHRESGGGFSLEQFTPTFDLLDKEDLVAPDPDLQTLEDLKEAMIDRIMMSRSNELGRIDSRKITQALTRPDRIRKVDELEEIMPQRWIIFGDCSGSMGHGEGSNGYLAGQCLGLVAKAAQDINDQAGEELIRGHVIAFDGHSYVIKNEADYEVDPEKVSELFARKVRHGGSTCLEGALHNDLDPLEQALDRRDLVIIFTDGDIGSTEMITERMDDGRLWVVIGIGPGAGNRCYQGQSNSKHNKAACEWCKEEAALDKIFKYKIRNAEALEDTIVRAIKDAAGIGE
jgi:hypothetical protein